MKAISLWQPWASLMATGYKKIETRSWSTKYRGPILIHAAKRKPSIMEWGYIEATLKRHGVNLEFLTLPLGVILCSVNLIDCQPTNTCSNLDSLELWLGNYERGRFMWVTDNLKRFKKPIIYRGQQGIFEVPDDVLSVEIKSNQETLPFKEP